MARTAAKRYVSVGEAALELRVSRTSVYRVVKRGTLPAVQLQPHGLAPVQVEGSGG